MEQWLPIKDYPNYEISNTGKVRNVKSNRILKPKNDDPYAKVSLYNETGRCDKPIHKIVAETYYDNPSSVLDINHKDGCKRNNNIDNLEYCTRSENIRHAYAMGLKSPSGPHPIRKIKVVETGIVYDSIRECARSIGGDYRHIVKCLKGERSKHLNYHFEYVL